MNDDDRDYMILGRAASMIAEIDGHPCINVDADSLNVCICRRIHSLFVNGGVIEGTCEWITPRDERAEELTDGLAIGCDCLDVGDAWWHDTYFNWYFVFDEGFVTRTLAGDTSWITPFLRDATGYRSRSR